MALVSRTVPALNVMILGMPVKIVVGLLTFVAILPIMLKLIAYGFNSIPDIFEKILKLRQTKNFRCKIFLNFFQIK